MARIGLLALAAGFLAMMSALNARADVVVDTSNVFAIPSVAQTLHLSDLDNTWLSFRLFGQSESGGGMAEIYSLYLNGGRDTSLYYTQGHTVGLAGQAFLIAYHVKTGPIDYSALMRPTGPPAPNPLTPQSELTLCLINLSQVRALDDVEPFDMSQALNANQAADAFAKMMQGEREAGAKAVAESNLRQAGLAILEYIQDHDEKFPPMKTLDEVEKAVKAYVQSDAVFQDTASKAKFIPNSALSRKSLATIENPADMVAFYDPTPYDGDIVVLFADGHVKGVAADEWRRLKKASGMP